MKGSLWSINNLKRSECTTILKPNLKHNIIRNFYLVYPNLVKLFLYKKYTVMALNLECYVCLFKPQKKFYS